MSERTCETCLSYRPCYVNSWCKADPMALGRYGKVDDVKEAQNCKGYRFSKRKAASLARAAAKEQAQ